MSKDSLALFMEECGAAGPLELIAEHPARTGPTRWAGLTLLAGLGALLVRRWARRPSSRGGAGSPGAPFRGALS